MKQQRNYRCARDVKPILTDEESQPIHDDYYFDDINGLDVVCEDCLIANHRKVVGDYID